MHRLIILIHEQAHMHDIDVYMPMACYISLISTSLTKYTFTTAAAAVQLWH